MIFPVADLLIERGLPLVFTTDADAQRITCSVDGIEARQRSFRVAAPCYR